MMLANITGLEGAVNAALSCDKLAKWLALDLYLLLLLLGLSEKELIKRWTSLRTQYTRYKKLAPSGEDIQYILFSCTCYGVNIVIWTMSDANLLLPI